MKAKVEPGLTLQELSVKDARYKSVFVRMMKHRRKRDSLIEVLHVVQDVFGYIPTDVMRVLSREMKIPPSKIYGVATFYHFFSLKPKGEHNCVICTGTACHVKGCQEVLGKIEEAFGIKPGETTPDEKLGLQTARCIGCCSMAPVAVMDEKILDKPTPDQVVELIRAQLETKR